MLGVSNLRLVVCPRHTVYRELCSTAHVCFAEGEELVHLLVLGSSGDKRHTELLLNLCGCL
jgi:hypothetical protein